MKIINCPPGSAEWYKARSGRITSSNFDKVLTPKKRQLSEQRWPLACRIVAERLLNWQADSLSYIEHIKAGIDQEPDALKELAFVHGIETIPGGFVEADDTRIGASPDALEVGTLNPIELKHPTPPIMLQYLLLSHDVYFGQRQGHLYVCQRDEAIFFARHPRMPGCFVRTYRDQSYIDALATALDQFADEVDALELRARALGTYQAFAEVVTPLQAERGEQMSEKELDDFLGADPGSNFNHNAGA